MKTKILSFIAVFFMGTMAVWAGNKTENFKVYGNCGMCENRIEKAAQLVEGVSLADWDKKSKMMTVTFDDAKTNVHQVHMAIANVGHDTDMHKAKDEVYNELPGCCKYERSTEKKLDKKHSEQNH